VLTKILNFGDVMQISKGVAINYEQPLQTMCGVYVFHNWLATVCSRHESKFFALATEH